MIKHIKKDPIKRGSSEELTLISWYLKSKVSMLQFSVISGFNSRTINRIVTRNSLPHFYNRKNAKPANHIDFVTGQKLFTKKGFVTKLIYLDRRLDRVGKEVRTFLFVRCECGREWWVNLSNIRCGGTKSCGRRPCKSVYNKKRDPEVGYRNLMYSYKTHARNRDLNWEITYEEFKYLISQKCFYCNRNPYSIYSLKDSKGNCRAGVPITYNGVDRLNSNGGYTRENCVTACKQCNIAKMDYTFEDFIKWIVLVNDNLKSKQNASNTTC